MGYYNKIEKTWNIKLPEKPKAIFLDDNRNIKVLSESFNDFLNAKVISNKKNNS